MPPRPELSENSVRLRRPSKVSLATSSALLAPAGHETALDRLLRLEREGAAVLQARFSPPGFAPLMHALGDLIAGEPILLYFSFLFWAVDRRACLEGIWLVPVMEIVCCLLKWRFGEPRPGWVKGSPVKILAASHEFSFPSSHAAISVALALFFWLRFSAAVAGPHALAPIAAGVCFSRVYEGAHYAHDVVAGALLGAGAALVHAVWVVDALGFVGDGPEVLSLGLGLPMCGLVLAAVFRAHAAARSRRPVDPEWSLRAEAAPAHRGGALDPLGVPLASAVGMVGVLAGLFVQTALRGPALALGASIRAPMPARVLGGAALRRLVAGAAGLVALFFAVRVAEKRLGRAGWRRAELATRLLRYGLMPCYITVLAPAAFVQLGL
jgi:membrane-associated phospholipid phosphatase